jgi:hypothetical protein
MVGTPYSFGFGSQIFLSAVAIILCKPRSSVKPASCIKTSRASVFESPSNLTSLAKLSVIALLKDDLSRAEKAFHPRREKPKISGIFCVAAVVVAFSSNSMFIRTSEHDFRYSKHHSGIGKVLEAPFRTSLAKSRSSSLGKSSRWFSNLSSGHERQYRIVPQTSKGFNSFLYFFPTSERKHSSNRLAPSKTALVTRFSAPTMNTPRATYESSTPNSAPLGHRLSSCPACRAVVSVVSFSVIGFVSGWEHRPAALQRPGLFIARCRRARISAPQSVHSVKSVTG